MTYDARIILAGQPVDVTGSMMRGNALAGQTNELQRAGELQNLYRQQGPAIMAGEAGALNALAGYDPTMALGVQERRQGLEINQANLEIARENARLRGLEVAASMTAAERAQHAAALERALAMGVRIEDPATWDRIMRENGMEDLVGRFSEKDLLIAGAVGLSEALSMNAPPSAQSAQGKFAADVAAGLIPEGTPYQGSTSITNFVGGGAVNEDYWKKRNEGWAADMAEIEDQEAAARSAMTSLSVMENAMSQPGFYSGTGSGAVMTIKRTAAALGLDPQGIDSMEAFNAQAKAAALDVMGGSLGTGFSNADRDFVMDQVPNLENSAPGNRELIRIQKLIQERKIEIARRAREYEEKHNQIDTGFFQELSAWAEENPLFPSDAPPPGNQIIIDGKAYTVEPVE